MNFNIEEVTYDNEEFQKLCLKLDKFQNGIIPERRNLNLSALDGLEKLEKIFLIYDNSKVIACGL